MKSAKREFEQTKNLLVQKSENDNVYISAMRQDLRKLKRELEKHRFDFQVQNDRKENGGDVNGGVSENERVG